MPRDTVYEASHMTEDKINKRVQCVLSENASWTGRYSKLCNALDGHNPRLTEHQNRQLASRARTTLLMMANQSTFMEGVRGDPLIEATFNASLNTLVPKVIDLVRIFYPNLIAHELVDIQPLDRQNGEVFIVKPVFSQTAAGVNAGDQVFQNITDGTYASEELTLAVATGDGNTASYGSVSFAPVPLKKNSVTVTAGAVTGKDDGAGGLSGTGITSGTINYVTGAFAVVFASNVALGVPIVATALWDYETGASNLRSVEIQLGLYPVTARAHPLNVKWSQTAELAAAAHLDLNIPDVLANLVASFIKQERDVSLINKILASATADATLNFDATPPTNYSRLAKYAEIELKVNRAESIIQNTLGRGGVSWVLCGINASDIFKNCNGFEAVDVMAPIGPHKVGTLRGGSLAVIKVPFMEVNTYVIGFKGYVVGDAATILAEWVPLYASPVFKAPDLTNAQGMMSLYALVMNQVAYYRLGKISSYAA